MWEYNRKNEQMLEHKLFKILVETIQDLVGIRCCETSMWESVIKGWRVKFPTKHYQNNCPSFTRENLVTGVNIETLLTLIMWTTFWLIVTWFPSLIWIFFMMCFCPNCITIKKRISLNVITVARYTTFLYLITLSECFFLGDWLSLCQKILGKLRMLTK